MTPLDADAGSDSAAHPSGAPVVLDRPDREPPFNLKATVASVSIGTTLEYVDFALYSLASALVFAPVFFPGTTPALAMMASFGTYAIGFLARPAGSIFFGWLGDRIGRRRVLIYTLMIMGLATTAIGALPGYAVAGYLGPVLLVVLRLCQGFAAGAELSGGAIMLTESAEPRRRGLIASMIAFGSNGGVFLASGAWLLITLLPEDDVVGWAWRIPFLCSIVVAGTALYLRRKMAESPVFAQVQKSAEAVKERAIAASQDAPRRAGTPAFTRVLCLRIAENGPSYLAQTFIVGYVANFLTVGKSVPTDAVFIGALLGMGVAPVIGHLTDRFGRRPVYRALCAILMVYPFLGYSLMDTGSEVVVFAVVIVGFLLASVSMFAAQAAFAAELFGSRTRFRKMALSKEVGSVLSGGIAPLVAAALLALTGHWWIVAAYSALMSLIGFVTTFYTPETRGRDLTDPNDAV